MNFKSFVLQKAVKIHCVEGHERLVTWRTITVPASEEVAVRLLNSKPCNGRYRALNSPCKREMSRGEEVTEWTL
jgi:hypothetical protein